VWWRGLFIRFGSSFTIAEERRGGIEMCRFGERR
jgi:hypothetical protein